MEVERACWGNTVCFQDSRGHSEIKRHLDLGRERGQKTERKQVTLNGSGES